MEISSHNCWTCADHKIGGMTFLGACLWFVAQGKEAKEIPPHVVDKGCKHWRKKDGQRE